MSAAEQLAQGICSRRTWVAASAPGARRSSAKSVGKAAAGLRRSTHPQLPLLLLAAAPPAVRLGSACARAAWCSSAMRYSLKRTMKRPSVPGRAWRLAGGAARCAAYGQVCRPGRGGGVVRCGGSAWCCRGIQQAAGRCCRPAEAAPTCAGVGAAAAAAAASPWGAGRAGPLAHMAQAAATSTTATAAPCERAIALLGHWRRLVPKLAAGAAVQH